MVVEGGGMIVTERGLLSRHEAAPPMGVSLHYTQT